MQSTLPQTPIGAEAAQSAAQGDFVGLQPAATDPCRRPPPLLLSRFWGTVSLVEGISTVNAM